MKRIMLIGETAVGKAALIRALSNRHFESHRVMAVEYFGSFINTPGEFLENRRFYSALIATSMECACILMIQDATRNASLFPPQFAVMFNRIMFGVISKCDAPDANLLRASRFLDNAGIKETVFPLDFETGTGVEALKNALKEFL